MTEVGVAVFLAERTAGMKAKARGRSGHAGAETGLDVTDGDVSKPKDPFLKAIPRMWAGRREGKPRDGNWGLG